MMDIKQKLQQIIGRAIIAAVKDGTPNQQVQIKVMADEDTEAERFTEYGFTSVPHDGSEAITVFVGGDRSHGIVIATSDRRYRLKGLQNGEVAIYTDEESYIKLARGKIIEIVGQRVNITAPDGLHIDGVLHTQSDVIAEGNAQVTGNVTVAGGVSAAGVIASATDVSSDGKSFNSHTHNENGTGGGTTTPPN